MYKVLNILKAENKHIKSNFHFSKIKKVKGKHLVFNFLKM